MRSLNVVSQVQHVSIVQPRVQQHQQVQKQPENQEMTNMGAVLTHNKLAVGVSRVIRGKKDRYSTTVSGGAHATTSKRVAWAETHRKIFDYHQDPELYAQQLDQIWQKK